MADENARLIGGELYTHTNDDDKDHNTGIYIDVLSKQGSMLVHCYDADNDTHYNDESDHWMHLDLDRNAWGVTKADCRQFHVHMWQRTREGRGHDTWKFDAQVYLYFSDGDNLHAEKYNIKLVNNRASVEFDAA